MAKRLKLDGILLTPLDSWLVFLLIRKYPEAFKAQKRRTLSNLKTRIKNAYGW